MRAAAFALLAVGAVAACLDAKGLAPFPCARDGSCPEGLACMSGQCLVADQSKAASSAAASSASSGGGGSACCPSDCVSAKCSCKDYAPEINPGTAQVGLCWNVQFVNTSKHVLAVRACPSAGKQRMCDENRAEPGKTIFLKPCAEEPSPNPPVVHAVEACEIDEGCSCWSALPWFG
jgi:hypothetical protein